MASRRMRTFKDKAEMSIIRNGGNECQILRQQTDCIVAKDIFEHSLKIRIPSMEEWDNNEKQNNMMYQFIRRLQ